MLNWTDKYLFIIKKEHVTKKTGVMMLRIQLYITGINYILKYINIEQLF